MRQRHYLPPSWLCVPPSSRNFLVVSGVIFSPDASAWGGGGGKENGSWSSGIFSDGPGIGGFYSRGEFECLDGNETSFIT